MITPVLLIRLILVMFMLQINEKPSQCVNYHVVRKNSCQMEQSEWLNGPPLQMASLGLIQTETHTVRVPYWASAKSISPTEAQLFVSFLRRSFSLLLRKVELMISHHVWQPTHLSTCCLSSSLKCDSQWKPWKQDIQAQEEYPRGIAPVRVVETCRGYSGEWEPAHGSHVARGRRPKWVGRS